MLFFFGGSQEGVCFGLRCNGRRRADLSQHSSERRHSRTNKQSISVGSIGNGARAGRPGRKHSSPSPWLHQHKSGNHERVAVCAVLFFGNLFFTLYAVYRQSQQYTRHCSRTSITQHTAELARCWLASRRLPIWTHGNEHKLINNTQTR